MEFRPSKTILTKLNTEYYIYIANFSEESFRIFVYKKQTEGDVVFEVPPSDPGQTLLQSGEPILFFVGTIDVKKTKGLNRCYKIYLENSNVGAKLFVKRLEKEGINLLKELEKKNGRNR